MEKLREILGEAWWENDIVIPVIVILLFVGFIMKLFEDKQPPGTKTIYDKNGDLMGYIDKD